MLVAAQIVRAGSHDGSGGYLATLRSGGRAVLRDRVVGRVVLVIVLLSGVTAVEEYFALLAVDLTLPAWALSAHPLGFAGPAPAGVITEGAHPAAP